MRTTFENLALSKTASPLSNIQLFRIILFLYLLIYLPRSKYFIIKIIVT
jgi:hypothetical protein